MAKTFKGFTNQQTHQLLKELGFTGPAQKDEMDAFLASSPSAASKMGRYTEIAKQRVEGGPLSGVGMQAGGTVTDDQMAAFNQANETALSNYDPNNPEFLVGPGGGVRNPNYTGPVSDQPSTLSPVSRIPVSRITDTPTALNESRQRLSPEQIALGQINANSGTGPIGYDDLTDEQKATADAHQQEYDTIQAQLFKDLGLSETGPTNKQESLKVQEAMAASPEMSALNERAQAFSSSLRGELSPPDTRTRMVGSPVDEQGRPLYRSELAGPPMPGIYPTVPEGAQVLKPGTPTPETTQASTDLDTAQQAYSDAMGTLTEAQKALSGAEAPEGNSTVDAETGKLPNASYEQILEEVGPFTSDLDSYVGDFKPFEVDDFKSLVASGNIPEDPSDYEIEPLGSEGINKKFLIKYPNGQSIEYSTYSAAVANSAPDVASMFAQGLNQAKNSNIYSETNNYNKLLTDVSDAELSVTTTQADVSTAQKQFETTEIPSTSEALGKAITNPSSVLSQPTVYGLKVEDNQLIDEGTGQVVTAATLLVKQAQAADAVDDPAVKSAMAYVQGLDDSEFMRGGKYPPYPNAVPAVVPLPESVVKDIADYYERQQAQIEQDAVADRAETYTAETSLTDIKSELANIEAATGTLSEDAKMKAQTMTPGDLAQLQGEFKDPAKLDSYNVVLTEDDVVRINEERTRMQAGMANALATGNTAAYEDIKAAYEQAGAAVDKAIQTGTIVGELKQNSEEFPSAALFDAYTKSEAAELEGEVEEIDPAKFETETPKAEAEVDYNLPPTQVAETEATKVEDAAKFDEYATAEEKKSEFVPEVTAEETTVGADEVVDVNKIINEESVIVTAKTLEALNEASTAKAATATFSQQLQAKAVKGDVGANSTVQGQMEKLMASFDDGTPAWAAGALRKANAAMSARGLGNSSMASAAIIQATLESAIPIAQQDAATFAAMDMENVRNEQAVALANAAAAQNFELANLSNEQAVRIQNSMNNANLQLKNLSNEQEAVLATAQFKAALQGQELSISANVALSNAARYAAVNDINLTNRQQTTLLKSTQNLEVEMANLSNSQQTALSNLQVQASMMGQELTNEQQVAVLESTQAFEAEMQDATMKQQAFIQDAVARAAMEGRVLDNKQQTALFNVSNVVAERGIELNNEQQTAVFNMSNKLQVDMAEMSNRQQTALANAQIEAAMKGQELTNKQQVSVITAERIAEIANMNFTAEQSRALQNAQLTQTVDLANLSNSQAKLLADCAALSNVDMANLSNNQQAAAQQASAFLEMDMANLDNEQQAVMFEAQSLVQSIFSDQAAENAQLQFNAESINQVNQFFESMSTQVQQFNTAQENAMEQFNTGEENSMTKFQAELDNQRDMFNAQNELVIAQANTVWRQTVATANTAALNEANMQEVMAANSLTVQGLNELWQQERDLMNFAWNSAEKQTDRDHALVINKISADAQEDSAYSSAVGTFLGAVVGGVFDNWSSIF
ncbi:hypothetical protein N9X16_04555 [Planktomarina temperata]|nr:hypothetical protein [Planktomarina temperata]